MVNSFNSLRTDICSSQVVDVSVVSDTQAQAQIRQSNGGSLTVEVVTVSDRSIVEGAFSANGIAEDAFLKQLNNELAFFGSTSFVQDIGFVSPSVRCTANRATYAVELEIEYTSDSPLACQGTKEQGSYNFLCLSNPGDLTAFFFLVSCLRFSFLARRESIRQ